jgi:DNA/RNA-binding domain of Phe-tRNA-synthetase-like protein
MRDKIIKENRLTPDLSVGINLYKNIKLNNKNNLYEFIKKEIIRIKTDYMEHLPEGYKYSRKLYKAFKIDPTKHRLSSEALWRRIKKGLDFPEVNPIVDLTNLLSLKYQISYGLYDSDKIKGEIIIKLGEEDDKYRGIRKNILNFRGKIVLSDEIGVFGNPSADSLRTSVDENSKNIMQVLFFHKDYPFKEKITEESLNIYKLFFDFE